jgi:hypothetical protein
MRRPSRSLQLSQPFLGFALRLILSAESPDDDRAIVVAELELPAVAARL